jgi:Holliday junction resolvase RusA-like endonuclease
MIEIDVDGRPAPKGSRISGVTKTGQTYTRPASRHEAPWIAAVKRSTQIVMRHHQTPEPPYEIELEFRLKPPQRSRRGAWPTANDLDKLARSTIDGLVTGKAIQDDRHVIVLTARKRFACPDEEPGVHVTITNPAASAQLAA